MPTPLSPHFTAEEFACKCGRSDCTAPKWPAQALIGKLETLRSRIMRPITITSGSRCEYWNRMVGGEGDSAHLTGEAADLSIDGSREAYQTMAAIMRDQLFQRMGYGRRDRDSSLTFHVDVATRHPARVLWTY